MWARSTRAPDKAGLQEATFRNRLMSCELRVVSCGLWAVCEPDMEPD